MLLDPALQSVRICDSNEYSMSSSRGRAADCGEYGPHGQEINHLRICPEIFEGFDSMETARAHARLN
jgi:hypothetical protein